MAGRSSFCLLEADGLADCRFGIPPAEVTSDSDGSRKRHEVGVALTSTSTRRNSPNISSALSNRLPRSFSIAFSTIHSSAAGIRPFRCPGRAAEWFRIWSKITAGDAPSKGALAGHHLVKQASVGKDIRAGVYFLQTRLFGRHVGN